MKNNAYKQYIIWAITAFAAIGLSILLYFVLYRVKGVSEALSSLIRILMPFIYGAVLAYLFNPIYAFCERMLTRLLSPRFKQARWTIYVARGFSALTTIALTLIALFGLFYLVMPQLIASVRGIMERMPEYLRELRLWLDQIADANPYVGQIMADAYQSVVVFIEQWMRTDLLSLMGGWAVRAYTLLFNLFIGLVVMIYLLLSKHTFTAQGKKMIYSVLGARRGNTAIDIIRYAHRVFGGFINGKLIESLLVGIVCFLFMIITNMPFPMLITVIIGVTNVIPFFGPFIGAIPSALLLLFESPSLCLYFLIFILIMQQIDCNFVAPRILRGTTGLPSFWVLFSILFFGGLFGFIGMVLGVPVFALIYSLAKYLINRGLDKHGLPTDTESYYGLHEMEEQ